MLRMNQWWTALMVFSLVAASTLTAESVQAAAPRLKASGTYTITDIALLETPVPAELQATPGCKFFAQGLLSGIADDGTISGALPKSVGHRTPFVYKDGKLTKLKSGAGGGIAEGVNAKGEAVGLMIPVAPASPCSFSIFTSQGAMWINHKLKAVPPPHDGEGVIIYEVNDKGQMIGIAGDPTTQVQTPYLWTDGTPAELPLSEGGIGATPRGINASGQVFGSEALSEHAQVGIIWDGDQITTFGPYDNVTVTNLNDDAVGVGSFRVEHGGPNEAFVTKDGDLAHLPTPDGATGSASTSIDNVGDIVGSTTLADGSPVATIWLDGQWIDLNTLIPADSGWVLQSATDINNSGLIIGSGILDGQLHGFLLTPSS